MKKVLFIIRKILFFYVKNMETAHDLKPVWAIDKCDYQC